mgnify:CR=1 FL=1
MIELGKKQTLQVVKTVDFGVYLAEDMNADTKHQVLLPAKQVPAGTKAGDKLEVFIDLLDFGYQINSIHTRHFQIRNNDFRLNIRENVKCFLPILCCSDYLTVKCLPINHVF